MRRLHVKGKVVDLLRKRQWPCRFDTWPFAILYATWMIVIVPNLDFLDTIIILGGLLAVHILVFLFTVWSVDFKCFVQYSKVKDIHHANACKITPPKFCGSKQLVPLHFRQLPGSLPHQIYFDFQHQCFIYSHEKNTFCKLPYPSKETFGYYLKNTGHDTESKIQIAAYKWGLNVFNYPQPTFLELMKEHCMEPLILFQVLCVGLWCLDGYGYYTLFTLFALFTVRTMKVQSQLKTLSNLRCARVDSHMLMAYRSGNWTEVAWKDLLPGDIVSIGRAAAHDGVPADMLILAGTATVNEAILTGDPIPQWKVSIMGRRPEENLCTKRDKQHVLFGGTKILQHTPDMTSLIKTPDGGCLAIVLRTGFVTTQGKLMRTTLFSTERVTTANSWKSRLFIFFLVVIAIIAASYLFKKGLEEPNMSRYKLLLSFSLIVTFAIPPELPTVLSMAVDASLTRLRWRGISCTLPFRIPLAGKVDICCFDKTGTLTCDGMELSGVGGLSDDADLETDINKLPIRTTEILTFCNNLALVDNEMVGDPLEKAAFNWSNKSDGKTNANMEDSRTLEIVQRHHFASQLKRMAVVVRTEEQFYAFVKGAPETIQERLKDIPAFYVSAYKSYARQGSHVLALAYKPLPDMTVSEARNLDREVVESGLAFAGFAVFSCPIRRDSVTVLSELRRSSLELVMITGDQALTACHVAREVNIISQPALILVLSKNKQQFEWVSPDETEILSYREEMVESLAEDHDLCIGGDCFEMLLKTCAFVKVIQYVKVFARVVPKQKELIMTTFKLSGRITMMCGDGTNDAGALKQAHVGVALLNARPPPTPVGAGDRHLTLVERQALKKMMDELKGGGYGRSAPVVKCGDTSMASPFTSQYASVSSTADIILQGRSTLVTTLQMFKIVGLNCLASVYGLSVMYLDGVKLGDAQASVISFFTTIFFLSIADTRPLPTLSAQRPHANVFCFYILLSIAGQLSLHLLLLISSVKEAKKHMPDSQFESDLVNTVFYMVSMFIRVATFVVNYTGHPFNESISENKSFKYVLVSVVAFFTVIASDVFRNLNDSLMLVSLPRGLRDQLLIWAAFMFCGCYIWERFLRWAFSGKMSNIHKYKSLNSISKK